ncbi:putative ABC transporter ATP-binding protein YbhF [Polystyrenella longa]|uniref:Putative ABC transporter ATP-binding protein YbhF n=1 Tax=Polystyrenella longa TaxID=2528007 RepID=A0A518CQH5_9PLAN|nr:ATP-binding cassette domain-containing protein [Polystyrenella longa]QDU81479.1 putative ABC transporter ATP-binding protein YbhF [Polystyrenella longa]
MLQLTELTKTFTRPGESDLVAVNKLSFEVAAGEVYGLLGPNGAGKTTTLRMVLGLLKPTSGDACVEGHSATTDPEEVKRQIGLVSASAGLYQWLTPREMLYFFADLYSVPQEQIEVKLQSLADLLDLRRFLDQRSSTLSTGQKQRVNLARALIHDPPVMLLDEPTRGLDIVGTKVIFDYVGHLRDMGKTVIVCTHRLDEAERICDRFGLLYFGRLKYEGTIQALREETGEKSLVDMFLKLMQEKQTMTA